MSQRHVPSKVALRKTARRLEGRDSSEVLKWAIATYQSRIVLACSFGGPTGMVLLDMLMRIDRTVPVYYLDTGLLFEQTHDLITRVATHYGIRPIAVHPRFSLQEQSAHHGGNLWVSDPDLCCNLRKVQPQAAFLAGYDAWLTGLRRSQSKTRTSTPLVAWDQTFGVAKICPLAAWDDRMVWGYIKAHDVPHNALNAQRFPSVGCTPCTRALKPGEDLRAGRWSDSQKVECGIHSRIRPRALS